MGECGEARLSRLLLFEPGCCMLAIRAACGENMCGWWGGGDRWCCRSMGNLRPAALWSLLEARAATAAAAICCWWPRAWGMTWLVHSTSLRSSSMSRFSFARRFWNQVITWNNKEGFEIELFFRRQLNNSFWVLLFLRFTRSFWLLTNTFKVYFGQSDINLEFIQIPDQ